MNNNAKFSYVLALSFIGIWICKKLQPAKIKNDLIVSGIAVPRTTYVAVLNNLYGPGVDSNGACDCLISAFYDFIKNDPAELEKFKNVGIYPLQGAANDSFRPIYKDCIRRHMLDSTYKLHWGAENREAFRKNLRADILATPAFAAYNPDSLSSCLLEQFNDKMTIVEYLDSVYFNDERLRPLIQHCTGRIPHS